MEKASETLCSREEAVMQTKNFWSTNKEVLGKSPLDCNSYPVNLFPNPLPALSSPYKKFSLNRDVKMVFESTYPVVASSQIAGLLNKASVKIASLSLLIGSGSDREHTQAMLVSNTQYNIYSWYITELYTWNLYNFINQYHPNKLNKNNAYIPT